MVDIGSRALGLKIRWRFEFSHDTDRRESSSDRVCVDIGQQLCPGVLDHHQGTGEPSCAAKEVIDHPELIRDHLLGPWLKKGPPGLNSSTLTWHLQTHANPDWDAVLASYLVVRIAEDGVAPNSIRNLVPEALAWDQGREDFDSSLQTISPGLLYTIAQADFDEDREKMAFGFRLLDYLRSCADDSAIALTRDRRKLYEKHAEFSNAIRKIESDSRKYRMDVEKSQILTIELPSRNGGKRAVSTLVCQTTPQSRLFKHWARSLGMPGSDPAKPFECLVVPYERLGNHPYGTGEHFKRVVISVSGDSDVHLGDIGRHLELSEQREREQRGIVQHGGARYPEISPSPDPWYDGRGHNYTIVDSPRGGTLLSYQQIIDCAFADYRFPQNTIAS